MKTIKAFIKLISGQQLLVKEQRRVDAVLFELKCAALTLAVVMLLLLLFYICGVFG